MDRSCCIQCADHRRARQNAAGLVCQQLRSYHLEVIWPNCFRMQLVSETKNADVPTSHAILPSTCYSCNSMPSPASDCYVTFVLNGVGELRILEDPKTLAMGQM